MRLILIILVFFSIACNAANTQVIKVFNKVKNGDTSEVSELIKLDDDIVPDVAVYLQADSEDVRREAVSLLGVLGGEQACTAILTTLTDSSADIRQRSARILYRCDHTVLMKNDATSMQLGKSIKMGNTAAAAMLLLANFPDAESKAILVDMTKKDQKVKLLDWMPPVSSSLVASVSLTRMKSEVGKKYLIDSIKSGSINDLLFILNIMPDIDDMDVLQFLTKLLSDKREISQGIPSGATPKRRLCDLAVNAFAKKLNLDYGFKLSQEKRYTVAELRKATEMVNRHFHL